MEFGSKYILANNDEEYESLSDDEFEEGMHVSDSGSEGDDECVPGISESQGENRGNSKQRKQRVSHWRVRSKPQAEIKESANSKASRLRFQRADTNVVSINFNALLSPSNMHAGEPVICSKCSAILSHISNVDKESKVWHCEFCGESMVTDIEMEEIPTNEDVTYLIEPAMTISSSTMSGQDHSLVIFCVDTSGSMCVTTEIEGKVKLRGTGQLKRLQSFNETQESQFLPSERFRSITYISRLQAMQAAVDHQLGEMAQNHPNRRVGLITFHNEVVIVGDGSQEEITVAGDKLTNEEQLCKAGSDAALPQAIKGSRKVLGEKVYELEEGGATALGPALTVAINMAAHHPGSKVILCTDGKANIGLGNLETNDVESGYDFYNKIGEDAVTKGVTVSIITIQGTDCKLANLGTLADKTGGQVNIVDPLKLTEEFGNILADPIIATRVKATFLLHKELYVVDDKNPESQQCRAEHNAGNVKSSSTITFEFAKRKNSKGSSPDAGSVQHASTPSTSENLATEQGAAAATSSSAEQEAKTLSDFPFQLQIEYMDTEGNKALRVITRTMPATTDRKITEDNANLEILGTHAAKKSAELALCGQYTKSRGVALMNQRLAWRRSRCVSAAAGDKVKYKNIFSKIQSMEHQIRGRQRDEIDRYGRTRSDSEASDEEDTPTDDMQAIESRPMAESQPPRKKTLKAVRPRGKAKVFTGGKLRKMSTARISEMDDDMANMVYQFRSVASRDMTAPGDLEQARAWRSVDSRIHVNQNSTSAMSAFQNCLREAGMAAEGSSSSSSERNITNIPEEKNEGK